MPNNPRDQQDAERMVRTEAARGGPFVVAAETTLMPMLIADPTLPDIPIVFANAAFSRLSGHAREEILGKSYHLLSGSGTDPEVARAIDLALRAGEAIVRQVRLYRRDGKPLWVLQHVAPVFEEDRIRHHFVSFVDITERKAAEDGLRQLNEELDHRVSVRTGRLDELNRQLAAEVERRTEVERVLRNTLADKDVLLRDKDNLMKEVNHRVKNTLQMASSFLRIQLNLTHGREPAVQEALHSAVERQDRMAEIHEKLYRTQGLQEIEFGGYLRVLCRDLLMSFEPAQSLRVVLDVDADEVFLKPDRAIPLALIANEAMINALKYAFPDGRSGRIAVSFRELSYEVLRMSISDDGIGMAEKRRTGALGLTLMELLAEQAKGGLTVGSGAGTTVTVSIPA